MSDVVKAIQELKNRSIKFGKGAFCKSKRFRKIWYCGHCSQTYKKTEKAEAKYCCDENEELSFECSKCGVIYHNRPKTYCGNRFLYVSLSNVFEVFGDAF